MSSSMKLSRKLPIVAGTVTMMLAAGTGTALAATSKGGPVTTPTVSPTTPAGGYTKMPVTKDGKTVYVEVPTASLGLVTPDSGLTLGDSCVLDFIKGFGGLAAEANDGASVKDLYLSEIKGFFAPYLDCSVWLRHHVKTKGSRGE